MLLGYEPGGAKEVTLIGTGADWLNSPSGAAAIVDMNPQHRARIQWLSSETPSTSQYVEIRVTWPGAKAAPLRVGALLGRLNLPVGQKVEVYGKLAAGESFDYPLGGNSLTETVQEYPDGTRNVRWIFDAGLSPCNGFAVRLYNDVGGITVHTASSYTDIGLLVCQPAVDIPLGAGFEWSLVDPRLSERTITSALHVVQRRVYREKKMPIPLQTLEEHYKSGLNNSMDYQKLAYAVSGRTFSVIAPLWQDENQALDLDLMRSLHVYGQVRPAPTRHSGGRYNQNSYELEEFPA